MRVDGTIEQYGVGSGSVPAMVPASPLGGSVSLPNL